MTDLDPFEIKILRELQRDANQTTAQVAERVGLSVSPCWRRIDPLERDGFIKKRVAIIDRRKVRLNAHVFAQVKLNAHGRAHLDELSAATPGLPAVHNPHPLITTTECSLRNVARHMLTTLLFSSPSLRTYSRV